MRAFSGHLVATHTNLGLLQIHHPTHQPNPLSICPLRPPNCAPSVPWVCLGHVLARCRDAQTRRPRLSRRHEMGGTTANISTNWMALRKKSLPNSSARRTLAYSSLGPQALLPAPRVDAKHAGKTLVLAAQTRRIAPRDDMK